RASISRPLLTAGYPCRAPRSWVLALSLLSMYGPRPSIVCSVPPFGRASGFVTRSGSVMPHVQVAPQHFHHGGKITEMNTTERVALPTSRPRYSALTRGEVPTAGQVVYLTGEASPQFATRPVLFQVA